MDPVRQGAGSIRSDTLHRHDEQCNPALSNLRLARPSGRSEGSSTRTGSPGPVDPSEALHKPQL